MGTHSTLPLPHSVRKNPTSRDAQEKQEQYEILSSPALLNRLIALARDYPNFATLTTTQEWFGLPRAGGSSDCTFDQDYNGQTNKGCNNYVLIIQDKEAYPDDPDVQLSPNGDILLNQEENWWRQPADENDHNSPAKSGWKYVPDVFLSGSVHGNERVGPTSLLEMSELLIQAAHCESLPRMKLQPLHNEQNSNQIHDFWKQELQNAMTCRQSLDREGVSSPLRQWLARLVATRRIIIIPTANALGYARNVREEDSVDPNRDFPFDNLSEKDCMQTIAGRSINELFRSHLFPIGLTFHGGMEVIGYEWGAPTYLNKNAPDAVAQDMVASAYSRYANGFPDHKAYDYGTMNDKVYYVRGGMEDWAFAGSWDPKRVLQCRPDSFGGYPVEKTQYNNSTLRAFNMLIETSNKKEPTRNSLGKRKQPLISSSGEENGHIARNIRLALLAIDVVEPYVSIRSIQGLQLDDDVVPNVNQRRYNGGSFFDTTKMVWIPKDGRRLRSLRDWFNKDRKMKLSSVSISWTVGGSFEIDSTELLYGPWDLLPYNLADDKFGFYPSTDTLDSFKSRKFNIVSPLNIENNNETHGRSRWHVEGAHPTTSDNAFGPTFVASIDLSSFTPGSVIALFAKAKVDKCWLNSHANVSPAGLGPVSHIVNSRTNPGYYATNAGKIIRGREDNWWYSAPIALVIGSITEEQHVIQEATMNNAPRVFVDDKVTAIHVNARMGNVPSIMESTYQPKQSVTAPTLVDSNIRLLLGLLFVSTILLVALIIRRRHQRWRFHRRRLERIAEEEEGSTMVTVVPDNEYHDELESSTVETRERYTID